MDPNHQQENTRKKGEKSLGDGARKIERFGDHSSLVEQVISSNIHHPLEVHEE